jgi:hypothetical protein
MALRSSSSSYAQPALLPGLGVGGKLRLRIVRSGRVKWLDQFETIESAFRPGSVIWNCRDAELDTEVRMRVVQFLGIFGFSAEVVVSPTTEPVELEWVFGALQEKDVSVDVLEGNYARLSCSSLKYSRIAAERQIFSGIHFEPFGRPPIVLAAWCGTTSDLEQWN